MKSKLIHLFIVIVALVGFSNQFVHAQESAEFNTMQPLIVDIVVFSTPEATQINGGMAAPTFIDTESVSTTFTETNEDDTDNNSNSEFDTVGSVTDNITVRGTTTNLVTENINIYPNPVQDVIYIEAGLSQEISVSIINMLGQVVYKNTHANFYRTQIEVSHLPKGIYLLGISTGNERPQIQKIQIAR